MFNSELGETDSSLDHLCIENPPLSLKKMPPRTLRKLRKIIVKSREGHLQAKRGLGEKEPGLMLK